MKFFDTKNRNLATVAIFVTSITVGGLLFIPFLQLEQLMRIGISNYDNTAKYDDITTNINCYHVAFAYHGQEISQKLNYAHFLPIGGGSNNTDNNQSSTLNQAKVIVNYTVSEPSSISNQNMTALMRVFTTNGTSIRSSPADLGFIGNNNTSNTSTNPGRGQAELATSITDNTVKNVRAFVFFTNAERSGNFSNPVNVNLTLGQTIPQ
jgi:hypothetical protein